MCICVLGMSIVYMYMENVYSTLALGKERELVKKDTALRKEYAVM